MCLQTYKISVTDWNQVIMTKFQNKKCVLCNACFLLNDYFLGFILVLSNSLKWKILWGVYKMFKNFFLLRVARLLHQQHITIQKILNLTPPKVFLVKNQVLICNFSNSWTYKALSCIHTTLIRNMYHNS